METITIAKKYFDSGYSVLPLTCDGSKASRIKWSDYHYQWFQLAGHFCKQSGIGLLCGKRSGNLEVLDFDDPDAFPEWAKDIDANLLATLPLVKTPSDGRHIYYRCETIEGSKVLARDNNGGVYIETRGEGAYIVAVGSPLSAHKLNKPYRLLSGNPFKPPMITQEQRAKLWEVARQLNRYTKPVKTDKPKKGSSKRAGKLPSDIVNAMEWEDILCPKGWEVVRVSGDTTHWSKPSSKGNHATTGYGDNDLFYCFSTEARPFDGNQAYNKFAVYTLLYHNGDFRKSAKAIRIQSLTKENDYDNEKAKDK